MTAKYLRETAMRAFNAFWAERVPGLRPTAGYPGDARRFREEIADRMDLRERAFGESEPVLGPVA